MSHYPSFNSSKFKTDIIFHPDIKLQFGNYNNPIEVQFNVVPELQTLLADGLLLSASMVFPVYNELEAWGNYIRLGPTTLNYLTRLKNDHFIYGAAGLFLGDRYGAEVGFKKYINHGMLVLDARAGYSGYAIMDKGILNITPLQDPTFSISAQHFDKRFRVFTTIGFHQFVSQSRGIRLEINRFFHEFLCGFWAVYTENSRNGGIQISLPLPPKKYAPRRLVRPRVASYLDMTYVGKYTSSDGVRLQANRIMDDMLLRNNPQYLKSKLRRISSPD
jgi:hypothetical protein